MGKADGSFGFECFGIPDERVDEITKPITMGVNDAFTKPGIVVYDELYNQLVRGKYTDTNEMLYAAYVFGSAIQANVQTKQHEREMHKILEAMITSGIGG